VLEQDGQFKWSDKSAKERPGFSLTSLVKVKQKKRKRLLSVVSIVNSSFGPVVIQFSKEG
jgi:hypothetical protein